MKPHEVLSKFKGRKNFREIKESYLYYLKEKELQPEELLIILSSLYPESREETIKIKSGTPVHLMHPKGAELDPKAISQIMVASELPVAIRGAILPDGHLGYALPIGGVIALENAVSPSFVGYDIGCMMHLSDIFVTIKDMKKHKDFFFKCLWKEVTSFGKGAKFKPGEREHEVMDDPLWNEIPVLKQLKPLAQEQLGSSGGGNHFANIMKSEGTTGEDTFFTLLTHSGSRGVGHKVATFYVNLAEELQKNTKGIPKGYNWLPLDTDAGLEYWDVMNLMMRYAKANHELIHEWFEKITTAQTSLIVSNSHNMATIEAVQNEDRKFVKGVVHRKGATPAQPGMYGVIPGSCSSHSYVIEGCGFQPTINSASHGAGRARSTSESKKRVDFGEFKKKMNELNILHTGIDRGETSFSYKNINSVIEPQKDKILSIKQTLFPIAVVMGGKSDDGD